MVVLKIIANDDMSEHDTFSELFPKPNENSIIYRHGKLLHIKLCDTISMHDLNEALYHLNIAGLKTKLLVRW